jgi:hypothetical protein
MNETQELLLNLIEHAKAGEHTKFEQLRFFNEYIAARVVYRSLNKVIADLEYSADNLFKIYCKDVKRQQSDINLLVAYKQFQSAIDFYKEERRIVKTILADYEKYFWEGDFLDDLISGKTRDV